jgi:hypothetical protein
MKMILIISLFYISSAFSTPFFYKCAEDGVLESKIQPNEINAYLLKLVKERGFESTVSYLCGENQDCRTEYGEIINLGKFSSEISTKLITSFDLNQKSLFTKELTTSDYNYAEKIKILGNKLLLCQEEKANLDPASLLREKCSDCEEKVVLYYPYYNNYMYISGCDGLKDDEKCDHILSSSAVKDSINKSLIMEADPYTTLAVGIMEKFNNSFETSITWEKTIPPRFWLSTAMGCHQKSAKDGVREIHNKKGEIVNKSLLQLGTKIRDYLINDYKKSTKDGVSYFCYQQGAKESEVSDKPIPNSCCMELPFKTVWEGSKEQIQSSLMFHNIKTQIRSPLTCKKNGKSANDNCQKGRWDRLYEKDPAFNIQRFQGYSKLHGGDEPVNAWRSGVNHFKTPVYGYQIMDYLINTLYTNPLLNKMVKEAQEKLKLPPTKSLICANSAPGVYVLDSNYYFDQGRDAKRLSTVFDVKDKDWSDLTRAQRRVMIAEFGDPLVRNGKDNASGLLSHFSGDEKDALSRLTQLNFSSIISLSQDVWRNEVESQGQYQLFNKAKKIYFDKYHDARESRGKASNYPWARMDNEQFEKLIKKLN